LKNLVDLKGFEPLTSSMPFKKYQSLTEIDTEIKGLADGSLDSSGRQKGLFHGLDSVRTPGSHRKWQVRAFTRAVASRCDCRLLEETTICVLIKDNPLPKANGQMPG
jgi:hypothetical protein